MQIKESAENYLETILYLSEIQDNVRAIDISKELGFSRPTVSAAIKQFKENDYIEVDSNNFITLTEKGLEIARKIYDKHNTIAKILISLGVDKNLAYEDACKLEHGLSDDSFCALKRHFNMCELNIK